MRGCFRTYVIDGARGREYILHFSPENAWLGDIRSATTGDPTPYFVDAIETSDVLTINLASFESMLAAIPDLARNYRLGMERSHAGQQRRIALALHGSAEERYRDFVERYPSLAARIPQHMLASYLGVTPETLSRVRAKTRTAPPGS